MPIDTAETHPTADTGFACPYGHFTLQRYPRPHTGRDKQQPLRAWDAADEYLLQWLHEEEARATAAPGDTLILNDSFGALTLALSAGPVPPAAGAPAQLWSQTDSFLAHRACEQNLQLNLGDRPAKTQLLDSLQWPPTGRAPLGRVVIHIPKTLALLEHQLYQLRPLIDRHTRIVAGAMVKHLQPSCFKLFERVLGPVNSSLAQKKARLLFCQPEPDRWQGQSPYPSQHRLPEFAFAISSHANVFSRAGLDIGTRLLLEHIPVLADRAGPIIDLGCGNGLLGLRARQLNPDARVLYVDESWMAVDSARANAAAARAHHLDQESGAEWAGEDEFRVSHGLEGIDSNSAELVLNNPPFHQQTTVGDHIAWQMFTDALRVLRRGGELRVIGNRHLNYHIKLKRLFGNCQTLASNRKFVVLKSVKR